MRVFDHVLLRQFSGELASLCDDMLRLESSLLKKPLAVNEAHRRSARNLAVRQHDVRGDMAAECGYQRLADILKRMQAHQEKKRSMLRELHLATSFSSAH